MLVAVCFSQYAAHAQADKLGTWNIVNVVYKPFSHFAFFTDFQVRAQTIENNFYYTENNIGAIYSIPKKIAVVVAAGRHRIFDYPGNFKNLQAKEFRLWEQVTFNTYFDPLRIEHRYRIEQRWVDGEYRNRFRYRINPVIPINSNMLAPHVVYATASEEVFLSDKASFFEQNQVFAGMGYYFSTVATLQAGVVYLYNYHSSGEGSGKKFIQTSLLLSFGKGAMSHISKHPSLIN